MKPRDIASRVLNRRIDSPYHGPSAWPVRPRWILLVLAVWAAWVAFNPDHGLLRIRELRRELNDSRVELANAKTTNTALDKRLHDPVGQAEHAEEVLRSQGMARPGEIVYRIDPATPDSTER